MIHWIDKGTDEEMSSFAERDGDKVQRYLEFTKTYERSEEHTSELQSRG